MYSNPKLFYKTAFGLKSEENDLQEVITPNKVIKKTFCGKNVTDGIMVCSFTEIESYVDSNNSNLPKLCSCCKK